MKFLSDMTRLSILFLLTVVLVFYSCSKERETFTNEELISVQGIDSASYKADGNSRIKLIISLLPESVDAANRILALESEGGKFSTETVSVSKDSMKAITYFIPGLNPGTFVIKASIQNKPEIFVTIPIKLEPNNIEEIISISLEDTLRANGLDIRSGSITLSNTSERSIKLKLSEAESVFLPGVYNFNYRGGTTAGIYFLSVELEDERNLKLDVPYYQLALSSNDVIIFNLDTSNLIADGNRIINGTIEISDYKLPQNVMLKLNQGEFIGSSKPMEQSLEFNSEISKSFSFKVSTSATAHVLSAEILNTDYKINSIISPQTSYPDSLILIPSAFEIDSIDGQVTLEIYLLKNQGKSSDNIPISMKAQQMQNGNLVDVGIFETFPILSDSDQKAQATYSLKTRNTIGSNPIIINAQVDVNGTLILSNSISLRLK
jgi:hypothetical protein